MDVDKPSEGWPWQRLLEHAELMHRLGRYKEASEIAWIVRGMIYVHFGINDCSAVHAFGRWVKR